jgi:hypothetical protein
MPGGRGVRGWGASLQVAGPSIVNAGEVARYSLSGGPAVSTPGVGNSAAASADGSTVVFYYTPTQSARGPITLVRDGVSRSIPVPGRVESAPVIAADGSGVVLVCLVANKEQVLLLAD